MSLEPNLPRTALAALREGGAATSRSPKIRAGPNLAQIMSRRALNAAAERRPSVYAQ